MVGSSLPTAWLQLPISPATYMFASQSTHCPAGGTIRCCHMAEPCLWLHDTQTRLMMLWVNHFLISLFLLATVFPASLDLAWADPSICLHNIMLPGNISYLLHAMCILWVSASFYLQEFKSISNTIKLQLIYSRIIEILHEELRILMFQSNFRFWTVHRGAALKPKFMHVFNNILRIPYHQTANFIHYLLRHYQGKFKLYQ